MNILAKTILTTSLIGLTSFATANTAVNQSALTPSLTTVKQALTLKDDTKVQLRGNVVKAIGDEKYHSVIAQVALLSILMMNYGKVNRSRQMLQ